MKQATIKTELGGAKCGRISCMRAQEVAEAEGRGPCTRQCSDRGTTGARRRPAARWTGRRSFGGRARHRDDPVVLVAGAGPRFGIIEERLPNGLALNGVVATWDRQTTTCASCTGPPTTSASRCRRGRAATPSCRSAASTSTTSWCAQRQLTMERGRVSGAAGARRGAHPIRILAVEGNLEDDEVLIVVSGITDLLDVWGPAAIAATVANSAGVLMPRERCRPRLL